MKVGLTSASVASLKPGKLRREVPDGVMKGLYLVIQKSGTRSWALRYRFQGKPAKFTLGPAIGPREKGDAAGRVAVGLPMTLAEARRAARDALQALNEGHDPAALHRESQAAPEAPDPERDKVRTLAASFVERYAKPRNRSWPEVERQFRVEILPAWGARDVQSIAKRDVLDLLDSIVDRGSPVTANRIYATLSRFFGWLVERDVLPASPMSGVRKPSTEAARERVLGDDELRLVWRCAGALDHPFGPLVRLMILTGQRRQEVAGMRRAELDGDVWVIPGARTKNGLEHAVPLARAAAAIIDGLPEIGRAGFVLTTTGATPVSGFSRAKRRLDALMLAELHKGDSEAALTPWTFHDLRRTMASGMARLNVPLPVIEKALNHASGSFAGIVGVYQRHDYLDEKRRAFETWANHVEALAHGRALNVLPLARAGQ